MTTSYKELLLEHEQVEKALGSRAIRSFISCVILGIIWIYLENAVETNAIRYSHFMSQVIAALAIWRFSYFSRERKDDKRLSGIIIQGVEYERKNSKEELSFFKKQLENHKPFSQNNY